MECLNKKIVLQNNTKSVLIKPIGDIHLGARNCDVEYLKRMIDFIKTHPNAYMLGMGDYADCIYGSDKRFDIESVDLKYKTPEDQINALYKLFKPIKHKIIGLLTGNHEEKIRKLAGCDLTRILASKLEVPYIGISSFISLSFHTKKERIHRNKINIYAHHGYFGGREKGSKVSNLMKISRVYDADVYLIGHCHDLFSTIEDRIIVSQGHLSKRRVVYGLTGTFLKTVEEGTKGYGEDAGYFPTRTGTLSIKLFPCEEGSVGIHVSQ